MIAGRIFTLSETPLHTSEECAELSKIILIKNITNGTNNFKMVVDSLTGLLYLERGNLHETANARMSDFIAEQEKTMWMLNAWLN